MAEKVTSRKTRRGFYIDDGLLEQVDDLFEQANVESRSEFLNKAMKYYIGYLTTQRIENYVLSSISSILHSTVKDTENRLARALFKLAVEVSKLSHVIAYSQQIDKETMAKLQVKCVEEVKKINGAVKFEDAYSYQRE